MTDGEADPVVGLRRQLQGLFVLVRRPTYRSLESHADSDGRALRTSTISDLLNGPAVPRWDTVETFVRACVRYAQAREITLTPDLLDLDRWHADYWAMENALADRAARRERIAGRVVPVRRRRLAVPAQLPAVAAAFTGRARHLAELHKLLPSENHPSPPEAPTAVVITAIDGTAGVGNPTPRTSVHYFTA